MMMTSWDFRGMGSRTNLTQTPVYSRNRMKMGNETQIQETTGDVCQGNIKKHRKDAVVPPNGSVSDRIKALKEKTTGSKHRNGVGLEYSSYWFHLTCSLGGGLGCTLVGV
jgi:hypothetical protein